MKKYKKNKAKQLQSVPPTPVRVIRPALRHENHINTNDSPGPKTSYSAPVSAVLSTVLAVEQSAASLAYLASAASKVFAASLGTPRLVYDAQQQRD